MYNLTQLEQAGFELTPLEKSVFENPGFQSLYDQWPLKLGSRTSGLTARIGEDYYKHETVDFKSTDLEKLTPSGAAKFFDEMASYLRSVLVLSAKVARDASDSELDLGLVQDLSLWMDGIHTVTYKPFRWVRFERDHQQRMKRKARETEVAELSQGTANVVILLLDKLNSDVREAVRSAVEADCVKRGIFGEGDDDRVSQHFHFPYPKCTLCNGPSKNTGGRHCDDPNSIVLVDCGDVPTIMKSVPSDVRRMVKPVRFTVPRSTFSDRFELCIGDGFFPQFSIFLLNSLSTKEKREFKSELEECLDRKQQDRSVGHCYTDCLVVAPDGRQQINALLLSSSKGSLGYLGLEDGKLWRQFCRDKKIKVDATG